MDKTTFMFSAFWTVYIQLRALKRASLLGFEAEPLFLTTERTAVGGL
jgi:hypothetical protein